MAHGTRVNGASYGITGGKCLVAGTEYAIKKGRTLIGGTGYDITFSPPIYDDFASNSWESIIFACQNNMVPSSWTGDGSCYKDVEINGAQYRVDVIGKNHDVYSDGGTAPLTFQLHDCYNTYYPMNSSNSTTGGYKACSMHKTHLPELLGFMPVDIKSAIRSVNKSCTTGGSSSKTESVACALFLLSEDEIFGRVQTSMVPLGSQYQYYSSGNSKIKQVSGSARPWWLRSQNEYGSYALVTKYGAHGSNTPIRENGVSFAFCF